MIETARLQLSPLEPERDAAFILRLLNEPSWLRFIGDRGVRTLDDARAYIVNGPQASYRENGFGLYRVSLRDGGDVIGLCGLIKRPTLPHIDIGFAFLPEHWRQGYAFEAARAAVDDGVRRHQLQSLAAITAPDNIGSIRVVEKLGLRLQERIVMPGQTAETLLFVGDLSPHRID